MNDTEIHNGLDKKELRDFFQDQMYVATFSDYTEPTDDETLDGLDYLIDINERQIKKLQFQLKKMKHKKYSLELMTNLGWQDWDVSYYVARTDKNWKSFIGTKEEFDNLIKQSER